MTVTLGDAPSLGDFEYEVSMLFWLPLPHADLLRATAFQHYDYKVRECAERGVINGLRNRAKFLVDDTTSGERDERDVVYTTTMRFRDFDLAMKAMEQCRPATSVEIAIAVEIRAALEEGMDHINAERARLYGR